MIFKINLYEELASTKLLDSGSIYEKLSKKGYLTRIYKFWLVYYNAILLDEL